MHDMVSGSQPHDIINHDDKSSMVLIIEMMKWFS